MTRQSSQKLPIDLLTVFGIALLVFSVTVTLHEGVHALVCIGLGGELVEFSAQHIDCNSTSAFNKKIVSGSAAVVNVLIGLVLYLQLRNPGGRSSLTNFTMWLFMLANLTSGVGYLAFSGVMGVGDYAVVIEGWQPAWLWRTLMAMLGFALFMVVVAVALNAIGRFIGGTDQKEQVARLQKVGLAAYGGAIFTAVMAGIFNPYGLSGLPAVAGIFAMVGGQSPLAWMAQWFQAEMFKKGSAENNLTFARSWPHIIAGVVAVAIYGFVLGPGIRF